MTDQAEPSRRARLIVAMVRSHGPRSAPLSVPRGVTHVLAALESAGVVLDATGRVVQASAAAHGLGLVWHNRLAHSELVDLVHRARRSGVTQTADKMVERGPFGDASLHIHARAAMLTDDLVLLLAEDRTETTRVEEVRRDFLANVSHELKTPIASMGLLTEAIEQVADDPDQVRRFVNRLAGETKRLARITNDMIQLSRLQSSNPLGTMEWVRLSKIVRIAVDESRLTAQNADVTLVAGETPRKKLYGSESVLVMAVQNLVVNAIQHSPAGETVTVAVTIDDKIAEISVSDHGAGIPPESIDRIFERFYRVEDDRSRRTGGTGLGLSIVRHAVANHGGDVTVSSAEGAGSTFMIRLPLTRGKGDKKVAAAASGGTRR